MEKSNNISFKLNDICRLCLTHDGLMRSIFDSEVTEESENCLPFRINSCVSIKLSVTDRLPSKICHRCLFKVDMFFEFKVMCLNSDNSLKESLDCSGDQLNNVLDTVGDSEINPTDKGNTVKGLNGKEEIATKLENLETNSNDAISAQPEATESYLDSSHINATESVEELKTEVPVTNFELISIKGENSAGDESEDSGQNHEDHNSLEAEDRGPERPGKAPCLFQECWKTLCHPSLLLPLNHSNSTEHSFACDLCPLTFARSSLLARHRASKHMPDDDRPFRCSICGRAFTDSTSQSRHMRMHASQRPFSCGLCPQAFNHHASLVAHISSCHHHHQQPQQLDPMDTVDGGARVRESIDPCRMASKGMVNGNVKRKRLTCHVCSKSFSDSYTLQRHGRTHTGERPYSCSICGKTFSRSWSLARHVLLHTGERPHCCPLCGKRFADRSHLLRHVRTHGRTGAAAESVLRASDERVSVCMPRKQE